MEIDLFEIFEPVLILGAIAFIVILFHVLYLGSKAVAKNIRRMKLRRVMKERLKNGEKVTINDEENTYFSYRAVRVGNNVYMPVLKMTDGKIVVDSLLERRHTASVYFTSEVPGEEYKNLLLRAKEEKLKK